MYFALAAALAIPWIVLPIILFRRMADSTSIGSESAEIPVNPPAVSVIIPARNEARSIGDCARSILANTYPSLELIVVDDNSTDGTGEIAREIVRTDPRARVVNSPPLPGDWSGKCWACATGAGYAAGEILCFTDADTIHRGDSIARCVNAMQRRSADLFSLYTGQRLESGWERIVQPLIFALIVARFGGTERVTRATRAEDKLANGQCLLVRRAMYERLGGHREVRFSPIEDIALAQLFFASGGTVVLSTALEHVETRMYRSLGEMVRGWSRTFYAGYRISRPPGWRAGLMSAPVFLLPAIVPVLPYVVFIAALILSWPGPILFWAGLSAGAQLALWMAFYRHTGHGTLRALAHPIGAAVVLYICLRSLLRGRRITWKDRTFVSD